MAAETVRCQPQAEHSPFVSAVSRPEPFTLVLLGVTGDLAARKILPSLYGLWRGGYFPSDFALVGVARRDKDDEAFRGDVRQALATFAHEKPDEECWKQLAGHLFYHRADFTGSMEGLADRLRQLEARLGLPGN